MNSIATFFRESKTGRFLIPLGIILIVFSIFAFISDKHTKNFVKIEGIVSKVELVEAEHFDADDNLVNATYNVYVKYKVNDREYNELLGELSGYKKGDKITIKYNPTNPKEISQPSTILLPIALLVGGIIALAVGLLSIKNALKKHKELKEQEKSWKNE